MAWVDVPGDAATLELERLTEPWRRRGERVPPVIAVLKTRPPAFEAVLRLNYALTFGASSLGRRTEELIAVWVSALNDCFFCMATHARYLEQVWTGSAEELATLIASLTEIAQAAAGDAGELAAELESRLPLSEKEHALLVFVAGLSRAPEASTRAAFERLRRAGYTEAELVDVVLVASNFAFMNRLASGMGVALDESKFAAAERMFGRAALDRHLAWASAHAP